MTSAIQQTLADRRWEIYGMLQEGATYKAVAYRVGLGYGMVRAYCKRLGFNGGKRGPRAGSGEFTARNVEP